MTLWLRRAQRRATQRVVTSPRSLLHRRTRTCSCPRESTSTLALRGLRPELLVPDRVLSVRRRRKGDDPCPTGAWDPSQLSPSLLDVLQRLRSHAAVASPAPLHKALGLFAEPADARAAVLSTTLSLQRRSCDTTSPTSYALRSRCAQRARWTSRSSCAGVAPT